MPPCAGVGGGSSFTNALQEGHDVRQFGGASARGLLRHE
jgi:hypothetical protein